MRVLYLSYDGLTDPLGQSQILPYLCGLSQRGFRFWIVSAEKSVNYQHRKKIIQEIVDRHQITWVPLIYTKSPPILSTLWDVFQMTRMARLLHQQQKFQVIHCRSYITALVGLRLKKLLGIPFIFDMRGFWADERVDGNLWKLSNPVFKAVYQYFKRKEKSFLQQADCTISLTNRAKNEIHGWPGMSQIPVQVIPCCVDTDLFSPDCVEESALTTWRTTLGLQKEDFVLLYLGAIGTWYMLEEMLDFFQCLLKRIPHAKFLFITAESPQTIEQAANRQGVDLKSLRIVKGERKEVPILLQLGTIALFFVRPTYSKMASSPTKQGELMSMGIPVICNAGVGDTDQVVITYQSGWLVNQFNEQEYRQAVEQLDLLTQLNSKQIRLGAIDFYSLERGLAAYTEVYNRIKAKV